MNAVFVDGTNIKVVVVLKPHVIIKPLPAAFPLWIGSLLFVGPIMIFFVVHFKLGWLVLVIRGYFVIGVVEVYNGTHVVSIVGIDVRSIEICGLPASLSLIYIIALFVWWLIVLHLLLPLERFFHQHWFVELLKELHLILLPVENDHLFLHLIHILSR